MGSRTHLLPVHAPEARSVVNDVSGRKNVHRTPYNRPIVDPTRYLLLRRPPDQMATIEYTANGSSWQALVHRTAGHDKERGYGPRLQHTEGNQANEWTASLRH